MSNSIAEAFKKLNVSANSDTSDYEHIFSVSYEYLSKVKNFHDLKAFKNCLVSLINLDKYYRAYEIIQKIPTGEFFSNSLILEVAYVYYKLGRSEELIDLVNKSQIDNEGINCGLKHITAQTYYKIGEYNKSLELYQDLIQNNKYDSKLDLIINERSIISQLNFNQRKKIESKFNREEYGENYDLFFNEALIELSNNNFQKSLELLERAEQVCLKQNSSFSQDDLLVELLPIKITSAYIYEILGETDKSLDILTDSNVEAINDAMIKLIVRNNFYSLNNEEKDFNLIDRELNYQQNLHKLSQKLTKFQYQVIFKNNVLLRYATGTLSKSQVNDAFITKYLRDFPGDLFPLAFKLLLKLDISFKDLNEESENKTVSRKIYKYIQTNYEEKLSNNLVLAVLLLVFVNEKRDNFDQSLKILEELTEFNLQQETLIPVLVGTLVKVYEHLNLNKKLSEFLSKLVEKLLTTKEKVLQDDVNYYYFTRIIGFKALNQGNEAGAHKIFEFLSKFDEKDTLIISILTDSSTNLLPVEELSSSKPIDVLLETNIDTLIPTKAKPILKAKASANKVTKKKKKAVFSASKVYKPESEITLDEERWLPMKLRSYYKPSKKEKKKVGGGHQGALETTPVPVQPVSATTSGGKNKKKKKGKK
ncbi:uncharacterized protein RJT20DRAFT_29336 [Scheffersomyces xylosifermentans]|uniref:uncharacterized protein n=1 Tax=Scheffersomyces xylosifermentans TaxID=1304137 RepID=UPI00315D96E2